MHDFYLKWMLKHTYYLANYLLSTQSYQCSQLTVNRDLQSQPINITLVHAELRATDAFIKETEWELHATFQLPRIVLFARKLYSASTSLVQSKL